jgi:hypothetical protein
MATTTTNFGWDIPQSTDLVKDGATAIAALGQDIDTAMVDLKGGTTGQVLAKASGTDLDFSWVAQDDSNAIQNAIVDAKGDLIAATAADTPARLAVGTDGQILTADSSAATGLAWAAPASGGGLTLLSTTSLTGSSVTISDISQSYKNLRLIIKNVYATSIGDINIRLNGDTGSNYNSSAVRNKGTTLSGGNAVSGTLFTASSVSTLNNTAIQKTFAVCFLPRYTDTDQQEFTTTSLSYWDNLPTYFAQNGTYDKSAAITSITIIQESGNFSGGTAYLYGES